MIRPFRPLYLIIKPPPPVAAEIHDLPWTDRRRGADLLHMTILALGDAAEMAPERIAAIGRRLDGLDAAPFRVAFDRVRGHGGHVELVPGEPLVRAVAFRRAVAAALGGLAVHPRPLRPHITLDYRHRPPCDAAIDPIAWTVAELLLVESVYGEGRHVERGRWALRPRFPRAAPLMPGAEVPMPAR